jgi:hypothetical protein
VVLGVVHGAVPDSGIVDEELLLDGHLEADGAGSDMSQHKLNDNNNIPHPTPVITLNISYQLIHKSFMFVVLIYLLIADQSLLILNAKY